MWYDGFDNVTARHVLYGIGIRISKTLVRPDKLVAKEIHVFPQRRQLVFSFLTSFFQHRKHSIFWLSRLSSFLLIYFATCCVISAFSCA